VFLARKFTVFMVLVIFQMGFKAACAADVSTSDVIKEIEKTLLFDKDSREKIDFYAEDKSRKRSDLTLNAGISEDKKDGGIGAFDIAVVDPKFDNLDVREKEKLAYNSALIGQYEVAIELYKQVLAAEPNNDYDKFSLAVVYQKIGQFRQAKTLYYQLLKSNPSNQEEIVGNLLAVLIEESPRDAVYLLSRLAVQNPKSGYVFAQAAIAYDRIKNYDQAINFLQKAITLDPVNANYQYNLAVIYDKTSQYEKALESYLAVVKNYTDENQSVPLDQVQRRIESIRNKF
jgi:tetratricopeptide (TPR) repeat protein